MKDRANNERCVLDIQFELESDNFVVLVSS
jgi:hypothetical protein